MDVINNIFYVNIFIFTERFPKNTTNKRKLNFNTRLHESKMDTLVDLCTFMFLFDLTNSA